MKVLFDTNILIDYLLGFKEAQKEFELYKIAEKELLNLTSDLKARFLHITDLFNEFGINNVGMPHVKYLKDNLWEMRLKGKDNIARSYIYLNYRNEIINIMYFYKEN